MTPLDVALLGGAGVGGGLTGSVAGLASLVSYPALLAVGLPPVAANVTNTVALVASSTGSTLGSRPELTGQSERIRRLGVAAVGGGVVGGSILLVAPEGSFALILPWLVGAASAAILLRPKIVEHQPLLAGPSGPIEGHGDTPGRRGQAWRPPAGRGDRGLTVGTFVVAVYGGYFGAAAGIMMLSLLLWRTGDAFPRCNAAKNVLLGMANAVAAVAFALFGPVRWAAVLPLAAGFLAGGWLGPRIVRRAAVGPLRVGIALAGMALAVRLGFDSYR